MTLSFGSVIFYSYICLNNIKTYNMDKIELVDKVRTMDKNNMDKQKILGWVMALRGTVASKTPTEYKIGDVFMHPIFKHPYVLMEYKNEQWFCALLTTEPTCSEILEPCRSRFFSNSFFTKVLFTTKEPVGSFGNVSENTRQINSVLKQLKEIFV